jgi:hypothetical protein
MRDKEKIGRNDLCPCGSSKKYKKCCSLNAGVIGVNPNQQSDLIQLNREIAYKGKIERSPKQFCQEYI